MAYPYGDDDSPASSSSTGSGKNNQWTPQIETFSTLASALLWRASDPFLDSFSRSGLYQQVVTMYERILSGEVDEELGMHRIDAEQLLDNQRAMLRILQAIVSLAFRHKQPSGGWADGFPFSLASFLHTHKDKAIYYPLVGFKLMSLNFLGHFLVGNFVHGELRYQ